MNLLEAVALLPGADVRGRSVVLGGAAKNSGSTSDAASGSSLAGAGFGTTSTRKSLPPGRREMEKKPNMSRAATPRHARLVDAAVRTGHAMAERARHKRRRAHADLLLRQQRGRHAQLHAHRRHRQQRRMAHREHRHQRLAALHARAHALHLHAQREHRPQRRRQPQQQHRRQQDQQQIVHPRAGAQPRREQRRHRHQRAGQPRAHLTFTGTCTEPITFARMRSAVMLRMRASGLSTRRCANTGSAMRCTSSGTT